MPAQLNRRTVLQLGAGVSVAGVLAACTSDGTVTATPTPTAHGWQPPADPMQFPAGFVWGAATSAFQVEGSTTADGRGPSIWDTFAATPGRIHDGSTGDPAADHYRLWESDLDLIADLGLAAYRFSVAWPRIQPTGSGDVNQAGVDFYRRLVDGLLARGIHPAITLYHWDLPQPLQDAGGWAVRETADRFGEYAAIMFEALRDVDATWLTINEPKTTAYVGYRWGAHAPGISDVDQAAAAIHHQLLGHGRAVEAFRASGAAGEIGIALNLLPVYPTSREADPAAVHTDAVENRMFLDPVLLGRYPSDAIGSEPGQLPADADAFQELVLDGDLEVISAPLDVLAVQYYGVTGVDELGNQVEVYPTSTAVWQQVHPEGLYDLLMDLLIDYPGAPPLVITENGIPDPTSEGTTDDPERLEFLRAHLQQAARAIDDGVRLVGYYAWSLLDNFEWAEGMSQRWGLVHVDFETQERTPKASAEWYSSVVRANAVTRS
ncbi:GH1 family beta-glucosidase [Cellulomonas humilata]|uniref:Beta-glucosidase n=1 Tax=Cellulomonas humilata TaxID=144055 RepID=A0ABU0EA48_9CELL|nr:GH1 family beta-glucosidase [Cellulomonas humilata]MDQ0371950.1 beta-glucosidase [Cellulomonas humilata]